MKRNPTKLALKAILFLAFCHLTLLPAAGQLIGMPNDLTNSQGMEGSWTALVTLKDCASGTPFFTFPAMQTYAQGGTMQDSSADSRRTTGHGVWKHLTGRTYEASFQFFNFDNTGAPQGTTRVLLTNVVHKRGKSFATNANVTIYDMLGNVISQACASSVANRFSP